MTDVSIENFCTTLLPSLSVCLISYTIFYSPSLPPSLTVCLILSFLLLISYLYLSFSISSVFSFSIILFLPIFLSLSFSSLTHKRALPVWSPTSSQLSIMYTFIFSFSHLYVLSHTFPVVCGMWMLIR